MSAPAPIIDMLNAGRAWDALAPALRGVHASPADAAARDLAIRVLARLGLRTPALELAEGHPEPDDPDAAAALAAVHAAKDDRFPADARLAIAHANADALAAIGVDLRADLDRFAAAERTWEVLATPDGNVVRRPAGSLDPDRWQWTFEQRRAAFEFARHHLASAETEPVPPITIEGFAPPWVFVEVARRTPRLPDGYRPRIRVVQRDPAEFFEGASLIDLRSFLAEDRVEWFVGEDAAERFAERVRATFDLHTLGPTVPVGTVRRPVEPPLAERARALGAEQAEHTRRLKDRVETRYAGRDAAHWGARYASAEPLRVLIPTTRYSTFMQHAARDLADAFERRGHAARVLIEPDPSSRFSAAAYHGAIDAFGPDLVVLINYPRSERPEAFPANVPFVCWIQDEMPHLYDPRVGAAQTDLDFVMGHVVADLFRRCGYDPARALETPVVVSETKFRDAPITVHQRDRFACDVAFVSHHSEPPERMHERKCAEANGPAVRAILDDVRPRIEAAADRIATERAPALLHQAVRDALRARLGEDPPPDQVTQYDIQYARPMLERIVRHRALAWAADACDRRGWTLHIHGRGWHDHPRFGQYAAGELEHGDDLRACYQSARVHLHLSAVTLVHQRVMECAMSGGLPIGVRSLACMPNPGAPLVASGVRADHADRCRLADRALGFATADHASLMSYAAAVQSIGAAADPVVWVRPERFRRAPHAGEGAFTAPWLLADVAELTFANAHQLESLVERARDDAVWRSSHAAFIARRAREHLTHRALVDRLLELMSARLADSARAPVKRAG